MTLTLTHVRARARAAELYDTLKALLAKTPAPEDAEIRARLLVAEIEGRAVAPGFEVSERHS